jgi:hypothetical protein
MKPPETNHGACIDTEGHSVFHILPPDRQIDYPPEPADWLEIVLECIQNAAVTVGFFCIGGLVAGLLFQLYVRYA